MKYRVGDKVRVKKWEKLKRVAKRFDKGIWLIPDEKENGYWAFTEFMRRFCGKAVEIAEVSVDGLLYRIKEDGKAYIWIEEFFDGKVEQSSSSKEIAKVKSEFINSLKGKYKELLAPSEERPSWNEYFMELAELVAKRSTCLRRKVGAIAVNPDTKRVLATGYNGAVMGSKHCSELGCMRKEISSGERFELCRAVHAESNLICQAARHGISLEGAWVYCTHKPCYWCLKELINAGIKKVIYKEDYSHDALIEELISQGLIELERIEG